MIEKIGSQIARFLDHAACCHGAGKSPLFGPILLIQPQMDHKRSSLSSQKFPPCLNATPNRGREGRKETPPPPSSTPLFNHNWPLSSPSHPGNHHRSKNSSLPSYSTQGYQMAKFDLFLSLDLARQFKERKGSNFAA